MCKCLIYILKISKISKKLKISDIFENITIFSNPASGGQRLDSRYGSQRQFVSRASHEMQSD